MKLPFELLPLIFRNLCVDEVVRISPRMFLALSQSDQKATILRSDVTRVAALFTQGRVGVLIGERAVSLHKSDSHGTLRRPCLFTGRSHPWVPVMHAAIEAFASNHTILQLLGMYALDESTLLVAVRAGNDNAVRALFHNDLSGCCYMTNCFREEILRKDALNLVLWLWGLKHPRSYAHYFEDVYMWLLECVETDAVECFAWLYHEKAEACYQCIFREALQRRAYRIADWMVVNCTAPRLSDIEYFRDQPRDIEIDFRAAKTCLTYLWKHTETLEKNSDMDMCGARYVVIHPDNLSVRSDRAVGTFLFGRRW